jgi:hypothetical protein
MSDINYQQLQEAAGVLADDHVEVDKLLSTILAALAQEDNAKSFEFLDLLWARLAVHIRAEHLCLFPSILEAPRAYFTGTSGAPEYQEALSVIDKLRLDHEFFMRELGTSVNAFRMQANASDPEIHSQQLREVRRSISQVQSRLANHNQLEENHVYKWIDVLLGEAQRSALVTLIRRQLKNTPSRFRL